MRRFLVTGGAGSFGTTLALKLGNDAEIFCYSRDPLKHASLMQIAPSVKCFIGSICDHARFLEVLNRTRPDIVIHAAALKHVLAGQRNPGQYVQVNVIGTEIVAISCVQAGVKKALLLSTDKAVEPINVYGLTKALAESVWKQCARQSPSTEFIVIRLGNVLDARGSVLRTWITAKMRGDPIVLRKPPRGTATRFVLSLSEAVQFALLALEYGKSGDILAPKGLPAVDITALAHVFSDKPVQEPLAPGEKQHEVLISRWEAWEEVEPFFFRVTGRSHKVLRPYSSKFAPKLNVRELVYQKFKHVWEVKDEVHSGNRDEFRSE